MAFFCWAIRIGKGRGSKGRNGENLAETKECRLLGFELLQGKGTTRVEKKRFVVVEGWLGVDEILLHGLQWQA